jgi:Putative addiction module component
MNTQDIPEWHKEELDRRLEAIKNGTEQLYDFDEALNDIIKELEN